MAKHHLDRCVDVPSSTWCNVCIHIMDELSLVIDCLCFFFLFSLLTTKVHNYPLFVYCLLGFGMTARPKRHKVVDCNSKTDLGMVCN